MVLDINMIGKTLIDSIISGDAALVLVEIGKFKEGMQNREHGAEYVRWISEPVNLTNVHQSLIRYLNIEQRSMAIRRMVVSRTQRAVLLMQAIEIAVRRTHKL
jgi:hypothetical protein